MGLDDRWMWAIGDATATHLGDPSRGILAPWNGYDLGRNHATVAEQRAQRDPMPVIPSPLTADDPWTGYNCIGYALTTLNKDGSYSSGPSELPGTVNYLKAHPNPELLAAGKTGPQAQIDYLVNNPTVLSDLITWYMSPDNEAATRSGDSIDCDEDCPCGTYKMAMFVYQFPLKKPTAYGKNTDYHFIRQDPKTKVWTGKSGTMSTRIWDEDGPNLLGPILGGVKEQPLWQQKLKKNLVGCWCIKGEPPPLPPGITRTPTPESTMEPIISPAPKFQDPILFPGITPLGP